jgi:hypothetical protein
MPRKGNRPKKSKKQNISPNSSVSSVKSVSNLPITSGTNKGTEKPQFLSQPPRCQSIPHYDINFVVGEENLSSNRLTTTASVEHIHLSQNRDEQLQVPREDPQGSQATIPSPTEDHVYLSQPQQTHPPGRTPRRQPSGRQ